jgi:hypothetical protein
MDDRRIGRGRGYIEKMHGKKEGSENKERQEVEGEGNERGMGIGKDCVMHVLG